ncbi:MAG TPA: hypothetical protein VLZ83_03850 [Edaphocola sp.]|nr:hypothetical protein [Edaphocola sp.]
MKTLTPIIQFYFISDFYYKGEGNEMLIDTTASIFKIVIPDALSKIISATKGIAIQNNNCFQVLMPIIFLEDSIQFNAFQLLPDQLQFYIQNTDATKYAYTGIPQQTNLHSILYLSPQDNTENYSFQNKNIAAFPCNNTGKHINASDSVQLLSAKSTLEDYINLINVPNLDFSKEIFNFIINGTSLKTVLNSEGLALLNLKLMSLVNQVITFQINSQSGSKLSKTFNKCFLTKSKLESNIIGIIDIPKSKLIFTDILSKNYENLNQFSLPFPNLISKLKVIFSTPIFDNAENQLTIDESNPPLTIIDHPELENYKQVTFSINKYPYYLNRQHIIKWIRKKQIIGLPFDPIANYNRSNNISEIKITKTIS